MSKLNDVVRVTSKFLKKHSPDILTGLGIGCMFTGTVLAAKAAPKAAKKIEEAEKEKGETLTVVEKVKVVAVDYAPAALSTASGIACLVGANNTQNRRNVALATAYKAGEEAFNIYKEKVVETIGEKKEKEIKDEVAKEMVKRNPVGENEVIVTEGGNTLCYMSSQGRYFNSSRDIIDRCVNMLNRRLISEMYISLNDFYYELGLSPVKGGDDVGWNVEQGLIDIEFSSVLAADGRPCLVCEFYCEPRTDYINLH